MIKPLCPAFLDHIPNSVSIKKKKKGGRCGDKTGGSRVKGHQDAWELEYTPFEERQRKWGLFSQEKGQFWGH